MGKNLIPETKSKLDFSEVRNGALVLRAVNHKLRQKMMELMEQNGKMTVTDLYIDCRIEQSVASAHLAILRRAKVVTSERHGKFIFYRVDFSRINDISLLSKMLTAD